jgi:uncharacterized cupredoxin-like copper-binding protein
MSRSYVAAAAVGLLLALGSSSLADAGRPGHSHDQLTFSAGEPGDPKKPAQVFLIVMRETEDKMVFIPDRIEVRKGAQVRFILRNNGALEHEFVLASVEDNRKHAEEMRKYPDMEHEDPNGKRLKPKQSSEIVWRFTKAGEFEFACLIPGHPEAGMTGKVIVK